MKILIIRHGDPNYRDDTLTERGWEEAKLLADYLEKEKIDHYYVSPLGRAQDTASLTLERKGAKAVTLPFLREFIPPFIKRPDLDGKPGICWDLTPGLWMDSAEAYDYGRWLEHPIYRDPDVEEEYKKVCEGLDGVLSEHGYRRKGPLYETDGGNHDVIALFCHFGVECVLLSHLLNISPIVLWHGTCARTTSVTTLVTEEREPGRAIFRMLGFGELTHLYVGGMEPSFMARFRETSSDTGEFGRA